MSRPSGMPITTASAKPVSHACSETSTFAASVPLATSSPNPCTTALGGGKNTGLIQPNTPTTNCQTTSITTTSIASTPALPAGLSPASHAPMPPRPTFGPLARNALTSRPPPPSPRPAGRPKVIAQLEEPRIGLHAALGARAFEPGHDDLLDRAGVALEHHDPIAEQDRLLDGVRDEDHRLAGRRDELPISSRITSRVRASTAPNGSSISRMRGWATIAGEADALLHAARELARVRGLEPAEADSPRPPARDRASPRPSAPSASRGRSGRCRTPCATAAARSPGRPRRDRGRARSTGSPSTST